MFIEPTITWVHSGFSGYIWLDTKIVFKKQKKTNRRRSDGTPLDGRHGISGLCDGSGWRCITKCVTMISKLPLTTTYQ